MISILIKSNQVKSQRNYSIDLFRIICAVLVVTIHATPFADISQIANIANLTISRIAVPFFFVASGYFYGKKLLNAKEKCKSYLVRMIIVYVVLSIIYQIANLIKYGIPDPVSYLKELTVQIFFIGTYYHLWYFPVLIYALLVLTFFVSIHKTWILKGIAVVFAVVGVLMCSYPQLLGEYSVLQQLTAFDSFNIIKRLFSTGIPFVLIGFFLQNHPLQWNKKKTHLGILCFAVGHITESIIALVFFHKNAPTLTFSLFGLVAVLFIACMIHPTHLKSKLDLSSYASNIYYLHPLIMLIVSRFQQDITSYWLFIITLIVSVLMSWIISKATGRLKQFLSKYKQAT